MDRTIKTKLLLSIFLFILSIGINTGFAKEKYIPETEEILNKAYYKFQSGELEQAEKLYQKVIEKEPENFRAHFSLGVIFQIQKKYNLSLKHYETCNRVNPNFAPTYNNIGWIYFTIGEYDQAQIGYMTAIEKDPSYLLAYNNLGIIFLLRNDLDMARIIFNKILKLHPNNIMALNNLGLVYEAQGKYDLAERKFFEILSMDPGNVTARINLARLFIHKGKWKEPGIILNQLKKEYPDSPVVSFFLAFFNYKRGDLKKAKKYLLKTLSFQKNHFQARLILSNILMNEGSYLSALNHLKYLSHLSPNNYELLFNIGKCYYYLENFSESINYLKMAVKSNPSSVAALNQLGLAYEQAGNNQLAYYYYYRCHLIEPDDSKIQINLARIYVVLGMYREADVIISEILEKEPKNIEALHLKSYLLWNKNQ